jgi:hypothetical protein
MPQYTPPKHNNKEKTFVKSEISSISFLRALIPFINALPPLLYYLYFLMPSLCD